ncbi:MULTISPECIES: SpoIIIAH-like family protein [Caproicibacterium]|uniref:SpoIIIAH-like family protein n=1 Tax=Caproicibacterium lactatifermentans TaxID=2666138 RepID=A0A859DQ10_9FIRM|nr:SpoIIIAH-like family protein [Caproicibacterium lactatifermentans]ARP50101.1 sporulation protein [Ruminococcaceae bacterium CPB6]MDD4807918.1 SpoIIIAH-like family protein [Oscillospiraceae bacterium]QKN24177.1 SpoIIIAH-like family protein [Caproicibacterium lactatifermentans]QKO30754.1 SpoIIIAH-like family protein [Caproicibacterium lactatifermentans]
MKVEKRQLVLAALVVALGAAVYLNWRFSNGNQILAKDAAASHDLGQVQLVNAGEASSASSSRAPSSAVSSAKAAASSSSDYFSEARLNRQKARDNASQMLEKTLTDAGSNDAAKKEAVQQSAALAQIELQESNAENILKAKGFSDCVVFVQNGECSAVVKEGSANMGNAALLVKDTVSGQTGVSFDKIKVIEKKSS